MNSILEIKRLNTRIFLDNSVVNAVCDFDLELKEKEISAIIGESGCGKTMSVLSICNLLPKNAKVISGLLRLNGKNLEINNEKQQEKIRGLQISYIFQNPSSYLNPLFTIGEQIKEIYKYHSNINQRNLKEMVFKVLELVNLKPAQTYYSYFPHQLSGGMNQRAMIAMAIAAHPKIIIADEPTSCLDRISQISILELLKELKQKINCSIIMITHDITIIDNFADNIIIMYAGRIVEKGSKDEILKQPKHPYTKALLECSPKNKNQGQLLNTIEGNVPNLAYLPKGCKFHPRCSLAMDICRKNEPEFKNYSKTHSVKCYL